MPSASGVYSLPPGYLAVTGQVIQASQHNPPLEDIAAALTLRLSRDGSAPMTGALKGNAGTAAQPSFTFQTATSNGIFPSANGVGVAVGGVQVAEFSAAGLASGVWIPGMIIPYALSTVPNALWVFPVGQTLSRTAYPTLWTAAQIEIAAGNTFFNNGDGSTTFGIGDLRGRVIAATDNMGGTTANRLISGGLAGTRHTVGGAGGEDAHALITGEIPTISSTGNNNISVVAIAGNNIAVSSGSIGSGFAGTSGNLVPVSGSNFSGVASLSAVNSISVVTSGTSGTSGTGHNNMQPTMLCKFIMFAGS